MRQTLSYTQLQNLEKDGRVSATFRDGRKGDNKWWHWNWILSVTIDGEEYTEDNQFDDHGWTHQPTAEGIVQRLKAKTNDYIDILRK